MSIGAPTGLSSPTTGVASVPEPLAIRHGGPAAHQAWETGVGFEQMLVSQLTQQLSDTVSGADPNDPSSGSGDSTGGGSGASGSPLGAFSSLLPGALSSSVMSAGGTGVAMQIAESIDPRLSGAEGPR